MAGRSGCCSLKKGVTIFAVIDAVLSGIELAVVILFVVIAVVADVHVPRSAEGAFAALHAVAQLRNQAIEGAAAPRNIGIAVVAFACFMCAIQILLATCLALAAGKKKPRVPWVWVIGTFIFLVIGAVTYGLSFYVTGMTVTIKGLAPGLGVLFYKLLELTIVCFFGKKNAEIPKPNALETISGDYPTSRGTLGYPVLP